MAKYKIERGPTIPVDTYKLKKKESPLGPIIGFGVVVLVVILMAA